MNDVLKRTILVIDDDTHLQSIFSTVLERAGYQVITRADATSGLRWLEQILPDLILLDVMLPDISGVEMLKQIRETENGRDVPVIIATASSEISRDDFKGYYMTQIMYKPILPNELVDMVNKFFSASAA